MRFLSLFLLIFSATPAFSDLSGQVFIEGVVILDKRDGLTSSYYEIEYIIINRSESTLERLELFVVGRDEYGKIIERETALPIFSGNFPTGLLAGDSLNERRLVTINQPNKTVVNFEVLVSDARFSSR